VITNAEVIARGAPVTEEWIKAKLGVETRRMAAPDEQASDLAKKAAERALESAGLPASAIDGIICSVGTGDVPNPATASYVQAKLGIEKRAFAFDIKLACAGSIAGVMLGRSLVESRMAKHVLVVGTQLFSRTTLDRKDKQTAALFGDGGGALIVSPAPDARSGILESRLHNDGTLTEIIGQYIGGTRQWFTPEAVAENKIVVTMDGRAIWDVAVRELPELMRELVTAGGHSLDDVDFVVSHQANERLLKEVMRVAGVPESKSFTNVHRYGNTGAASALVALDEAVREGFVCRGQLIIFLAIGAGMGWGGHLIRW
jgi:3-oxoacyl-[acyl-carrier-protein] synthase-3